MKKIVYLIMLIFIAVLSINCADDDKKEITISGIVYAKTGANKTTTAVPNIKVNLYKNNASTIFTYKITGIDGKFSFTVEDATYYIGAVDNNATPTYAGFSPTIKPANSVTVYVDTEISGTGSLQTSDISANIKR